MNTIGASLSSVVGMVNQRASSKIGAQSYVRGDLRQAIRKIAKTNPQQVENKEYNESYFDKANNPVLLNGMKLNNMPEEQKIAAGVGYQMSAAETFIDVLQRSADYADLEIQYENLVASGNPNEAAQKINERALAFYREIGSEQSMTEFIDLWRGFDFSKMYDNATKGGASVGTNYILDDLSSLEYLGLNNQDELSAAERKAAIVNAIHIVSARIAQTSWNTDKRYQNATQTSLDELDARHRQSYATSVWVLDDFSKATIIGSASLEDLLNGIYGGRPEELPEPDGEEMSYYEYMKTMGVSVTGKVDIKV